MGLQAPITLSLPNSHAFNLGAGLISGRSVPNGNAKQKQEEINEGRGANPCLKTCVTGEAAAAAMK